MAMNDPNAPGAMPISRRALARAAMGGAAALALPAKAAALPQLGGAPVVGFHADAPWLDPTGRDKPYHPPTATGRFAPDTESLMRLGHFL
jgi:hypothetical protein